MNWLRENLFTLLFGFLFVAILYALIHSMFGKKGKGTCNCGCSVCSGSCPHCVQFKKK